jgi:hypothetical protein
MRRGTLCTLGASLVAALLLLAPLPAHSDEPAGPSPEIKALLEKAEAVRKSKNPVLRFGVPRTKDGKEPDAQPAKPKPPSLTDDEINRLAEYYRAQYPFRSLRGRLVYEKSLPPDRVLPKISEATNKWLKDEEEPDDLMKSRRHTGDSIRSWSLFELHSKNVRHFITQEGAGISRFRPPSPEMLELPEYPPVTLPTEPAISSAHLESPHVSLLRDEPEWIHFVKQEDEELSSEKQDAIVAQRYRHWAEVNNPEYLPTIPRLRTLSDMSFDSFASRTRIGFIKDLDHVAGFEGHAVMFILPSIEMHEPRQDYYYGDDEKPIADPTHFWQIRRMNLVSLLKFPQPAVYESKNVPAMQELAKAKTRPLDKFETDALQKLRDGEQIVVAAQTNRILMLGSLRATKRCLDCHAVQHGELLGAFSYELIRVKPISAPHAQSTGG